MVEHLVRGLDPAAGRQAVHHLRVRRRGIEQRGIDLVARHERGASLGYFRFLAHPPPQVGVDEIGLAHGRDRVFADRQAAAGEQAVLPADRLPGFRRLVTRRCHVGEVHAHAGAHHQQRGADVGGVADEDHAQVRQFLVRQLVLEHGEDVAHDLGRVVVVGQAVDDRHGGVRGQVEQGLVTQGSRLDGVDHAADDLRGVLDVFALAQVDFAGLEVKRVAAKFGHGHFEGNAGARGRLLEDHAQRGPGQQRWQGAQFVGALEQADERHQRQQLASIEVLRVEEMPHARGPPPGRMARRYGANPTPRSPGRLDVGQRPGASPRPGTPAQAHCPR